MPKRDDLRHVLVIGSGPILIGQAAEFDYSGTQACRVLKAEGLRVSLVNSNPATIMTDPEIADATYVEPLTPEFVEKVIAKERPDALLATLGGQTALNIAIGLYENGVLERYGVRLIGADVDAINRGEDRQRFKDIVRSIGADAPRSRVCASIEEALETAAEVGYPVVIRPSFTMGGLGSGIATDEPMLRRMASHGLADSPVHTVLIEESVLGWKEFELELMRDRSDNVVVICSIENVDAMGVHTGDSVTVAPAMTLTDVEYQRMRDVGIAVLRAVGVDTGGCNIQFAVNPADGRLVVIEMNPRVSRSSALASKATGFPIAKIAAKLAIGYTLDEITNDITGVTPASFEPALDYVVVKIPRFAFEKFPGADPRLTTTMKSVGEVMALGRNFPEALGKAMRSTETKVAGFWTGAEDARPAAELLEALRTPVDGRLYVAEAALRAGATVDQVAEASGFDPWFVDQLALVGEVGAEVRDAPALTAALLHRAKRHGLSDRQIAALRPELAGEDGVRVLRRRLGVRPVYKTVDTCAAEFAARTPYHYSSYDEETEVVPRTRRAVLILGSGPNRIGQGIEFDYSCVHAVMALQDAGYEAVMVNCNPETVSTDYDTADRLYFEPLTFEDVLEVVEAERAAGPVEGVICTLGGQTPLALVQRLKDAGVPVLGTAPEAIDDAEHRGSFSRVLRDTGLPAPSDGTELYLGGVMEHIEEAGIHSGDSACALPPTTLGNADLIRIRAATEKLAARIGVRGLVNVQYAIKDDILYVIEANPRASRTVPFVSKATAVQLAKAAARIAVGESIAELRVAGVLPPSGDGADLPEEAPIAVKEAVLPFHRFRTVEGHGVDTVLGPEMKSTGEMMGLDAGFGPAFAKSQAAAYGSLPTEGTVFVSLANRDKRSAVFPIKRLADLGFTLLATTGTAQVLRRHGVDCQVVGKYSEGPGNCVEKILAGEVDIVVNTPFGSPGNSGPRLDGYEIRTAAGAAGLPPLTPVQGLGAAGA